MASIVERWDANEENWYLLQVGFNPHDAAVRTRIRYPEKLRSALQDTCEKWADAEERGCLLGALETEDFEAVEDLIKIYRVQNSASG